MKYEVIAQSRAVAEAEEARADIAARDPEMAERWITELDQLFEKLSIFPNRFPMAPESPHTSYVVRHILVGKYRVLFAVDEQKVYLLRIRHSSKKPFKPGELD